MARKMLSGDGKVEWLQGRVTRATDKGIKMALADMMLLEVGTHDPCQTPPFVTVRRGRGVGVMLMGGGPPASYWFCLWLQEADDLITTAGSSFGRIAHARKGVPPYVVTKMGSCVRQLTSEPCSRLWFQTHNMTCMNRTGLDRSPMMVNHDDCDETW